MEYIEQSIIYLKLPGHTFITDGAVFGPHGSPHEARAAEDHGVEAVVLGELDEGAVLDLLAGADDAGVRAPRLVEAVAEPRAGQHVQHRVQRGHEHLDVGEPGVVHPELGGEVDPER